MESMGEQPVSSNTFIAVFQIMQKSKIRVSRQIDLHGVNNLTHLFVRKLACAGLHLNSEFHAMHVKSTAPCDGNINIGCFYTGA